MANTVYLLPLSLIPQWFTNAGLPAGGGMVQTYLAGTTTPVATYTDSTGTVQNPNPMTLSSSGRPVAASGAPVAFWVPSGTVVKFVVTDGFGNQLDALDQVSAINDPAGSSSLQVLLASAASSNSSGAGPVAGADLVANAVKSYDVFADVRAANSPILATGQTLNIQVQGAATVNDGLGGDFFWNPTSMATDNGTTVLKPNSVATTAPGRWLRLGTPPYGAQASIAAGTTTDLGTLGTNILSITGSSTIDVFGSSASVSHPLYFLTFATGGNTLVNNAQLLLPAGINIVTSAGDSCIALYLGSGNWQVLAYYRVNGIQSPVAQIGQEVASSTVKVPSTFLTAALAAGAGYLVQVRALFSGVGSTAMGYACSVTYSGTTFSVPQGGGVSSSNGTASALSAALGATISAATVSDTAEDFVNIDYVILTNAAGTLNFNFAQNSSNADSLNLVAGSAMLVTRMF